MILETKGTLWLLVTGAMGLLAGIQMGESATVSPTILLSIIGAVVGVLIAVFGWILRQIHRELRELVLTVRGLDVTIHGDRGHGGLMAQVDGLDKEKVSEHRVRSIIQGHVDEVLKERERSRGRGL